MKQQFVGVVDVFDVEKFDVRVALGVKVLVHVLQYVLYADLLSVARTPHGVERQPLDYGRLEYEHGRGAASAYEVNALFVQCGDGFCEDAVVPCVHQSDAVGADESRPVLFACCQYALFKLGSGLGFLAKSGRDYYESLDAFLGGKHFNVVRAHRRGYYEHGQVGRRQLVYVVEHFDALHLVFLGVDYSQRAFVASAYQIAHQCAARFVYVVRAAHYYDAFRA